MSDPAADTRKTPAAPSILVGRNLDRSTRVEAWRQAVSAIYDLADVDPDTFDCGLQSWNLGPAVLGEMWSTGNRFVRSEGKVAASGLDHYLIQLLTRGRSVVRDGAPEIDWLVGSVRILDMARPVQTQAEAFANITLIVPCAAVQTILNTSADLHGVVLPPGSNGAMVLGGFMRTLAARADSLTQSEAEAFGRGAATLVASCFEPSVAGRMRAHSPGAGATRSKIQGFIEARLGDPDLDATAICEQFGLSLATLYRLFAPLGGVNAHVRSRRLNRAYRNLRRSAADQARVSDIARELGFRNLSSFSRDFRVRFDASPLDVRRQMSPISDPDGMQPTQGSFKHWLEGL